MSQSAKNRNLSMEIVKLAAACFVVLIHAPFPGRLGEAAACLGRFAVPFFFAVSGYFSFGIGEETIKKRIGHMGKLHLITAALSVAVGCGLAALAGENVLVYLRWHMLPDLRGLLRMLLLQVNPYGGHLWYLTALLLCYLVLLAYSRFWQGTRQDNRPLYGAGFVLFAIYFTLAVLLDAEGVKIPFKVCRSGWLTGIPMFLMGMFLHEYGDRIRKNNQLSSRKMLLLIFLGFALSLLQWASGQAAENPLGVFLTVPVLILYLAEHPRLPGNHSLAEKAVSRFGVISTAVYLLHIAVIDLYNVLLKPGLFALLGSKEPMLMPVFVLCLTFLGAILWERIDWLRHRKK